MRILITGSTGFVGCHLVRALLAGVDADLHALSLHKAWPSGQTEFASHVQLHHCDLCQHETVLSILREVQPDRIYHLAGYADIGRSFQEPEAAWDGNLTATRSLYEAVHRSGGKPRILYVGSGAVYGEPSDPGQPVSEQTVLRPNSPYAASKAAADLLSFQYTCTHGLHIVRTRPFNHVGPGQSNRFALANFAWQIAAIETGLQEPVLRVGNLYTERDLTDVRDVVHAYMLLLERGVSGDVYNIASGRTLPMQTFLDRLLALSRTKVRIEVDPTLVRKVETATIRVDTEALREATGWSPQFSLEQTLADTLEYCRRSPQPMAAS